MPPEMRIKKITGSGVVHLTFTNAMDFPDDLKDRINSALTTKEQAKRDLEEVADLLSLMMVSKDKEEVDDNMVSWEVTAVTSTSIDCQLNFN